MARLGRRGRLIALAGGAVLLVVVIAVVLSIRGRQEVGDTLNRAFTEPIDSADVALDLSVQAKGVRRLEQPVRLRLNGPYRSSGGNRLPAFDWDLSIGSGGQALTAGLVSTGDNAFVQFQDVPYEFGRPAVAQINQQIAQRSQQGPQRSLSDFGVDPSRWVDDPEDEGEEEIAGVETDHIRSGVDVGALLEDLNRLVERAGGTVGAQPPRPLTESQRKEVEEIVQDPQFDVYVGQDDGKVRRISTELEFEVPEERRRAAGGAQSGRVSLSLQFSDVGGDKRITAPGGARPIRDLVTQLGGLFGGGLGGGGSPPGGATPPGGGLGGP